MNLLLKIVPFVLSVLAFAGFVFAFFRVQRRETHGPTLAPRRAVPLWVTPVRAAVLCLLFILACLAPPRAAAQATTLVAPRITTVLNGVVLAPKQLLNTNGNAAIPANTNLVAGTAPTLVPFVGSHPIGLSIQASLPAGYAALPGSSNLVVNVYRAFDTNGPAASSLSTRTGTNFESTPFFSWTNSYTTNFLALTNLIGNNWEPATTLGFTVNNLCNSNITVTLQASQAP